MYHLVIPYPLDFHLRRMCGSVWSFISRESPAGCSEIREMQASKTL
jgi:hypothetical protein